MNAFDAIYIVEVSPEGRSPEEILEAWQFLHDSRIGYQLQGWYGRALTALLQNGEITP